MLTVFTSLACSPRRTSRVGEDCRPRTTWRPLTLLGQPGSSSLCVSLEVFCHADKTVPRQDVSSSFLPCMCHPKVDKGVCTHAGSGPLRVRRRLLTTSLGDPISCEWEVIVQGDEGPICGVAQVVDCHGVTVGHQEREEEEVEQEVESDGEKTLKERCACPWMG